MPGAVEIGEVQQLGAASQVSPFARPGQASDEHPVQAVP